METLKASDLRIGNLVMEAGEVSAIYQIERRYKQKYRLNDVDVDERTIEDRFKPIPLTDDWLYDFGFANGGYESLFWWIGSFRIAGEMGIYGRTYDATFAPPGLTVDIKYVHQLQNLYHALTGTELTLKNLSKV